MRNGILFALVFWAAPQLACGQGYYPGPGGFAPQYPLPAYPPGGMMPYSPPAYPNPGYGNPQAYGPYQGSMPGPYSCTLGPLVMTPDNCRAAQCAAMPDNPGLPVPVVPRLPVCPDEPCEPTIIGKLGPCYGGSCGSGSCGSGCGLSSGCCSPSWTDCPQNPNQGAGGYCLYGKVEILYWWLRGQNVTGLTDTGNISGSTISVPGFSFDIATVVPEYTALTDLNHLGLRFTNGFWLNEDNTWAIEGNVFFTMETPSPYYASGGPSQAASAAAINNLSSLLHLTNAQTTSLLKGLTNDNVVAVAGFFAGGELNLRHEICRSEYGHLDWLLGARMLELYEYGGVLDSFGGVVVGTQNQFIGGQVGLEGEVSQGRWYLDSVGKVALGSNHEIVSVGTTAAPANSFAGVAGNDGVQNRDMFTAVGEVGVTAGIRIGCNARLFANYTIIYMTDAVRPLPQVAPYLGGATPGFSYASSAFWAQGVSLGFEYRF